MKRIETRQADHGRRRTQRASLNPYFMDDTAFTRADIIRDRTLDAAVSPR